jgi:hypothetical protein
MPATSALGHARPTTQDLEAPPEPPERLADEYRAENLRTRGAAAYLHGTAAPILAPDFSVSCWKVYVDRFMREAGDPKDPIERLLVEQLLLAHDALGRLHVRAGSREGVEEVNVFLGAIARLLGEFRRTALALQAYRQGQVGKGAAVTGSQARSAAVDGPPAAREPTSASPQREENGALGHNRVSAYLTDPHESATGSSAA